MTFLAHDLMHIYSCIVLLPRLIKIVMVCKKDILREGLSFEILSLNLQIRAHVDSLLGKALDAKTDDLNSITEHTNWDERTHFCR